MHAVEGFAAPEHLCPVKNFKHIMTIRISLAILFVVTSLTQVFSQDHAHLHVNPKWKECSFQLDPSLTRQSFHRFTQEAGMVAYFRPLVDAKAMGVGKVDISVLQWKTQIDENSEAWNNTFVHPDSAHWLADGPRLAVPGLAVRTGITKKLDIGLYWTTNPNANYGIAGAQLQYNLLQTEKWAAASRLSYSTVYGPEDLSLSTYGIDLAGSRRFNIYSDHVFITPYSILSLTCAHAREKSDVVNLPDETVLTPQAAIGVVADIWWFRLGIEYNQGCTNTVSLRIGSVINFSGK
jgi:hypothetical protein